MNNTTLPTLTTDVLQDDIAVLLARAIATANKRAHELGVDALNSLITINRRISDGVSLWRINYGPKGYIGRRSGDLIVAIDPTDASIKQVLRGP